MCVGRREDRVTSMGQPHRARVWGGNPDYRQVVTKHFLSAPPGGYWSRRAPVAKSEAGARGRPSQGEGSAASADLEAGATRQGAGVSPDG